jgi:predicted regulator of Ras-like GTPase activity (Roadblock/LC7/MglB family)
MTRRSRSSFDLRDVLPVAEALSPKPPAAASTADLHDFGGVPLVNFGGERASQPPAGAARVVAPAAARAELESAPVIEGAVSLMARLSRLLEWLRGDRDVTRALVVDDEGLPLVGSTSGDLGDAESLLAATGSVASAMKRLALATPGSLSGDFEGHVGDGPVLQLIGIPVGGRAFIVGISRRQPFGKVDVENIRAAFEKALASSALTSSSPGGA